MGNAYCKRHSFLNFPFVLLFCVPLPTIRGLIVAFACLFVPDFPVQALVRVEPELRGKPVAVMEGAAPLTNISCVNERAREAGVETGMSKIQADAFSGIHWRWRSALQEKAAHAALLDCAWTISPRVEERRDEAGETLLDAVVLDIAGCDKLFGSPEKIAGDLKHAAAEVGFDANVAVAGNPEAAVCAARGFSGITVIADGEEGACIGTLPLTSLSFPAEIVEILKLWGIQTCAQFAALPEIAVVERFGQEGRRLQLLARGADPRPLLPKESPVTFEECKELDFPVDLLEPLLFVLNRLLEQLCARLRMHVLAASEIKVTLTLEGKESCKKEPVVHVRTLRLPVPATESKFLLKLLQLDLQKHPPDAPVVAVNITATPARGRKRQLGLFLPLSPEPERLEITLARIENAVGEGRVGAPALLDTHRPNAFEQKRFVLREMSLNERRAGQETKTALRIYRPPLPATLHLQEEKPVQLVCEGLSRRILAFAGPWRTKGNWWSQSAWARDEWDVLMHSLRAKFRANTDEMQKEETSLYRIFRDLRSRQWFVEGIYD